ncbi:hypothetical protein CPLU01_10001 [Colletotrichum plurivorum]|uniref:Uncharacterized protein n=1 Tax=Colletotrichum plurivorum TaxID=2175906 RepID=A0A8H6K804_9PEZI|nr:hypothetical protein CPLU01_10001 [Colletotrichum plurivorum]
MKVGSLNRLENVDVTNVQDDEELFSRLRAAYGKHRGVCFSSPFKSLRDLGLKGLLALVYENLRSGNIRNPFKKAVSMRYIRFDLAYLQRSREAVRNIVFDSIPSKDEVARQEYAFSPCPPQTPSKLPIESELFMHAFLEPGDHFGCAMQILPKKLHIELFWDHLRNNNDSRPCGWGFYIEDGVDWGFVTIFVLIIVGLLLLTTVLWCCLTKDVQGGTGIGQFGLAILATSIALMVRNWHI